MKERHITNTIRTLRFMNGEMTQQDLARQVGVTRQTIISLEKNKYAPSLELAFRIAQAFGVPLTEVFSYQPIDGENEDVAKGGQTSETGPTVSDDNVGSDESKQGSTR